jgi:F0F1-type ATP synthase membrane subunit b/b'
VPEEPKGPADAFWDGIKAGLGILGAFAEAFQESFEDALKDRAPGTDAARDAFREARRRTEEAMEQARTRAEEAMEQARRRAEDAMERTRDRFDFVTRKEFETLQGDLAELRHQFEVHLADPAHHQHPGRKGKTGGEPGPEPTE